MDRHSTLWCHCLVRFPWRITLQQEKQFFCVCSEDITKTNKIKLVADVSSYHLLSFFAISVGNRVGGKDEQNLSEKKTQKISIFLF